MPDATKNRSLSIGSGRSNNLPAFAIDNPMQREILLVESSISMLTSQALLLANSNYCVTTASSDQETFTLRHMRAVTVAILSASLGQRILRAVAEAVRRQWPLARILILGRPTSMLEDDLYDDQIDRSPEPKHLFDTIEKLFEDSWNPCPKSLDWRAGRYSAGVSRSLIQESDPTKSPLLGWTENKSCRDRPSRCGY